MIEMLYGWFLNLVRFKDPFKIKIKLVLHVLKIEFALMTVKLLLLHMISVYWLNTFCLLLIYRSAFSAVDIFVVAPNNFVTILIFDI
jgi:hypothetical protein